MLVYLYPRGYNKINCWRQVRNAEVILWAVEEEPAVAVADHLAVAAGARSVEWAAAAEADLAVPAIAAAEALAGQVDFVPRHHHRDGEAIQAFLRAICWDA